MLFVFYLISVNYSNKMTSAAQSTKNFITLKGSAEIICEYLDFGINSILYLRGIYPPEDFKPKDNYGLQILMSQDKKVTDFLKVTLTQLSEWLIKKHIDKVSLIIVNVDTKEPLERWDFKVQYCGVTDSKGNEVSDKPLKDIQREIRDILKQIASSVSYLPLLDSRCSIDLLMYTKDNVDIPEQWEEMSSVDIKNAQTVGMRSFSTNIHKMTTAVVYKSDD